MKVLTLNIGAASAERAARIADWLDEQNADAVVLTETSKGTGSRFLFNRLLGADYYVEAGWPTADRGVMVASRVSGARALPVQSSLPHRALGTVTDHKPVVRLIGVYAPSRSVKNRPRKRAFFASLLEYIELLGADRLVLVGDYNAIARDHEPQHPGFRDYEYAFHDRLGELGLRSAHEEPQPHSWIGRSGAGYLYDYIHVGAGLQASYCCYIEETCHRGLSDHAAVIANIEAAPMAAEQKATAEGVFV